MNEFSLLFVLQIVVFSFILSFFHSFILSFFHSLVLSLTQLDAQQSGGVVTKPKGDEGVNRILNFEGYIAEQREKVCDLIPFVSSCPSTTESIR